MQKVWRQFPGTILWLNLCGSVCLALTMVGCFRHAQMDGSVHSLSYVADTFFYVKPDPVNGHEILMARKRMEATGRKLLDLESLAPGKHPSNVEIQPSGDGKYVGIGVPGDREGYSIRILDVAKASLLPDSISRSFDGDASWSDNNTTLEKELESRGANQLMPGGSCGWPHI